MDAPTRRIAEWVDDWFVAHLRRYTAADVRRRLVELGFDDANVLAFGVDYDTSQRRQDVDSRETAHMGEGDLRYFCQKRSAPRGIQYRLPDAPDDKGSQYTDAEAVTQFAEPLALVTGALNELESRSHRPEPGIRTIVCRTIHAKVRSFLESQAPFDAEALRCHLAAVASLIDDLSRGGAGAGQSPRAS
jgi:hypothetical protein